MRKLGKVMETVAAYRLKEIKHFQVMQKLATWRRTYGYDRDNSWTHGTRPLAPEEFTASLWEEVNAMKEALDTCVCVDIEEKYEECRMNPEPTELESPSAGTGLETPGQQCPPNGETGRTIAKGYLLVGMGSNQGGDTSSPTARVGTRAGTATTPTNSSNTIFLKASRKSKHNEKRSEENKQFDPGGKGEKPPPWNAAVMVLLFFFLGGMLSRMVSDTFASCSLSVCACLFVLSFVLSGGHFFSELKT